MITESWIFQIKTPPRNSLYAHALFAFAQVRVLAHP